MVVFDKYGMYETLENLYSQVEKGYELGVDITVHSKIENIVVVGVGASAMPGYILQQYLHDSDVPVFVIEDYSLPGFVTNNSLVFVISYTGNSDETLHLYKEVHKLGCQIISIGAAGKLRELAMYNKTKHILIPSGMQGRLAYPFMFFPILRILENSGVINEQDKYVKKTSNFLRNNKFEEITGDIAEKIISKTPVIYSSTKYEVVARKWKLNFNETAEIPSFYNTFPGAFHNDIAGFAKKNLDFYFILIKSNDETPVLLKKEKIFKELLKELNLPIVEVGITGDCYLAKIFSAMLMGDWMSYTLAIKKGVEPSSRRIVDEFEKRMNL